jgi:hypothetical protein
VGRLIPTQASIRPTAWPDGPAQAVFDIVLSKHEYDLDGDLYGALHAVRGLAVLLHISEADARQHLQNLPFMIGSGLGSVDELGSL